MAFYLQLFTCSLLNVSLLQLIATMSADFVMSLVENCNCEQEEELSVIVKFFSSIYQTIMFIQNLLILLKLEGVLTWYWRQVFCGYWIMVSILAGIILIVLLFSFSTLEKVFD